MTALRQIPGAGADLAPRLFIKICCECTSCAISRTYRYLSDAVVPLEVGSFVYFEILRFKLAVIHLPGFAAGVQT